MDQNKQKKKHSLKPVFILLIFASLFIGGGIYYLYFYNLDAVRRQETEAEIADEYLEDLIEWAESGDGEDWYAWLTEKGRIKASQQDAVSGSLPAEAEESWSDDNWYTRDGIVYTPEYARGYVQCVLEVPAAKIRRGVYSGTWEDILYDLDIWMVTASRPDYELGETHFCIYGHNHTKQDLSFNRLKDVKAGDTFSLTSEKGRYEYEVTNIFAVTRETAAASYADNFSLPKEKCYIITCGRGENRYVDLIVEGTLSRYMTVKEYAGTLRE